MSEGLRLSASRWESPALRGMTGTPSAPYAEGGCPKNATGNVAGKTFFLSFFFFPSY